MDNAMADIQADDMKHGLYYDEQMDKKIQQVREIFPNAQFEYDNDGQLIIYTDVTEEN